MNDNSFRVTVQEREVFAFETNGHGHPRPSQGNIRLALLHLKVTVSHDIFSDRLLIDGIADVGPLLDDHAMNHLWLLIERRFGFRATKDYFWTVISDEARRNAFHPVRDYLAGLMWDGVPRLDTWLTTLGGAKDTPYTRAVGRIMLLAAVKRVRQPGCKFDEIIVIEGPQGANKSSALQLLAVKEDWFADDMPLGARGKEMIEAIAGRWIVEASELAGMSKAEVEHVKANASRRVDRGRMSYERCVSEKARQCIIVGTTNSYHYLRDLTGNRRFWPVSCGAFDLDALARDRDQLWAEAAHRSAEGETIRLPKELWDDASAEQKERAVEDPWQHPLEAHLGQMQGKIRTEDIWHLLGMADPKTRSQHHNSRLGEVMRVLGWQRKQLRFGGRKQWAYWRGSNPLRPLYVREVGSKAHECKVSRDKNPGW
jgi:predicted P-loop ATPase